MSFFHPRHFNWRSGLVYDDRVGVCSKDFGYESVSQTRKSMVYALMKVRQMDTGNALHVRTIKPFAFPATGGY